MAFAPASSASACFFTISAAQGCKFGFVQSPRSSRYGSRSLSGPPMGLTAPSNASMGWNSASGPFCHSPEKSAPWMFTVRAPSRQPERWPKNIVRVVAGEIDAGPIGIDPGVMHAKARVDVRGSTERPVGAIVGEHLVGHANVRIRRCFVIGEHDASCLAGRPCTEIELRRAFAGSTRARAR